ncbi:MAG TPA: hypothetical protein VFA12_20100 [Stellaceae bacterium]|nr:hypothetical protein [Stellaceae bacterium]
MAGVALVNGGVLAPAPQKTLRVIGGNLFRIALDELGDATQWDRIAVLNGLTDPWIQGSVTLLIPSKLDTGGQPVV